MDTTSLPYPEPRPVYRVTPLDADGTGHAVRLLDADVIQARLAERLAAVTRRLTAIERANASAWTRLLTELQEAEELAEPDQTPGAAREAAALQGGGGGA